MKPVPYAVFVPSIFRRLYHLLLPSASSPSWREGYVKFSAICLYTKSALFLSSALPSMLNLSVRPFILIPTPVQWTTYFLRGGFCSVNRWGSPSFSSFLLPCIEPENNLGPCIVKERFKRCSCRKRFSQGLESGVRNRWSGSVESLNRAVHLARIVLWKCS